MIKQRVKVTFNEPVDHTGGSSRPPRVSAGRRASETWSLCSGLALIALAVFVTYGNTLHNEFIHDDKAEILQNRYVRDSSNLTKLFTTAAWAFGSEGPYKFSSNYYRPIQYLSYAVLYRLFGPSPWGYHLYKLLSHLLVSWLVFWIFLTWLPGRGAALFGSLLFSVHTANTEAVAWISGITDTTCTVFFLLSLLLYLKDRARPSLAKLLLLPGLFLVGMLAKETMATFLGVLFVYEWVETGRLPRRKPMARVLVPLLATFGGYLVLRIHAIGAFTNPKQIQLRFDYLNEFQILLNQIILLAKYVALFFFPVRLNAYHLFDPVNSLFDFRFGLAAALVGIGLAIFIRMFKRLSQQLRKRLLLGLAWFVLTLVPVILFFKRLGENVFAERYLYLPSIGLCLCIASGLPTAKSWGKAARIGLAALIAAFSWMSVIRNRVWQNELIFYETTAKQSPGAASILNNLGATYNRRQRPLEAIGAFERSIAVHPSPHALKNLAYTYAAVGRSEDAETAYLKAIALDPSDAGAYSGLGDLQLQRERYLEAIDAYQKALAIYPASTVALFSYAQACVQVQRYDDAVEALKKVLALSQSESVRAYRLLATIYRAKKLPDLAAEAERKAASPMQIQLFR